MKNYNLKLKTVIIFSIIFFGVFLLPRISWADTIHYVDDCSPSGVSAAHSVASDGDTIYLRCNISGDEVTWTSDVTITKHVTIQGKGPSITKISWESGVFEGTPENGRIKLKPTTNPSPPHIMRVTGIHFYSPNHFSTGGGYQTSIHVYGITDGLKRIRIDNSKFTNGNHNIFFLIMLMYAYGLIDNNTFLDTNTPILITGDGTTA